MTHTLAKSASEYSLQTLNTGRENNFNLVRIVFAALVAVAHGWLIYTDSHEHSSPFVTALYYVGFGVLDGFFIFSGFMVTGSIVNRKNLIEFFSARFCRIYPGLLAVVLVSAFIIGPLVTTVPLGAYFSDFKTYAYVLITGITTDPDQALPGVFETHAATSVVNASIWTLRYELVLYIFTGVVFAIGMLNRKVFKLIAIACVAVYLLKVTLLGLKSGSAFLDHMGHFGLAYVMGMLAFVYQDKVILRWQIIPALALATWATHGTMFEEFFRVLAFGYTIFWIAYAPSGVLKGYNKVGDYSFGLYIWHWPIASALLVFYPGIQPPALVAATLAISLVMAVLSWHLIEKRSLAAKKPLANFIRSKLPAKRKSYAVPAE